MAPCTRRWSDFAQSEQRNLREISVFFPSIDEQAGTIAIVDAVDRKIDLHRWTWDVLDKLFQALL